MSFSIFDCEILEKGIKKEVKSERESPILSDLCLDPYSRFRYLDRMSHSKMEPNVMMVRKIQYLKERMPQRHQGYMEKILKQLQNGGLSGL